MRPLVNQGFDSLPSDLTLSCTWLRYPYSSQSPVPQRQLRRSCPAPFPQSCHGPTGLATHSYTLSKKSQGKRNERIRTSIALRLLTSRNATRHSSRPTLHRAGRSYVLATG